MQDWLDGLKVGDEVAVNCGKYSNADYRIAKITKITPSRRFGLDCFSNMVFDNEGKERANNSTWSSPYRIVPVTNEIKNFLARRESLEKIKEIRFEKLTLDQMIRIIAVAEELELARSAIKATESPSSEATEAE
jgi:hypothetical protein